MAYEFTLKFQISDEDAVDVAERLARAGCTDALLGTGQPGCVALMFMREATSAKEAFESAMSDVKSALPEARFTEAECTDDFVRELDLKDGSTGGNPFAYGDQEIFERLMQVLHENMFKTTR